MQGLKGNRMKKLSRQANKLKAAIIKDYQITDEAGLAILQTAMECFDEFHAAKKVVDEQGLTIFGSRNQRIAHPLLAIIRDSRAQFLMALKHLNLDLEPVLPPGRPPGR